MHKIVITGGCGFIGSHLSEYIFKIYKKSQIIIIDKITYAANKKNISNILNSKRVKLIKDDICNFKNLLKYTKNANILLHVAAESHVDNSYNLNDNFIMTNVLGTKNVIEACKINKINKIIHVSTDEVYGEIYKSSFKENSSFNPSNPYSSSKAAAEMIINGYIHSYKLPIIIIRSNNIFGIRQHPEKLIAGCCWSFIKKKNFQFMDLDCRKDLFYMLKIFVKELLN